jgi:hypothetical protein
VIGVPGVRGANAGYDPASNNYPDCITSPDSAPAPLNRVALLVDYPVLLRAVRAVEAEGVPRLADIVRAARELGAVFISRAYGAWYDIEEATAAFSAGLDPVFVPPAGPGSVPTLAALLTDGQAILRQEQADVLALCGDDRLLPLMLSAQEAGVRVGLIAHACLADGPCLKLAETQIPAAEFVRTITRAERYRRSRSAA